MTIFFTSDLHFYHKNIIKFCNRPFSSIEEMNQKLIDNWNSVVTDKDIVYVLGDFSFSNYDDTLNVFKKLNGCQKFLISGNHDKKDTKSMPWAFVKDAYELKVDGQYYYLSHYPHLSWNKSYHGSYHLYGHVHSNGNRWGSGLSSDVGVDNWNYTPVSIDTINKLMFEIKTDSTKNHIPYFLWKGKPLENKLEYMPISDIEHYRE